jgi:NAD(P)H-flavin reductase/ferredoxin
MVTFQYQKQTIQAQDDQTVLEALLKAGIEISYGCKVGACQSCLCKALPGPNLSPWQEGLTPAQKEQRLFYACTAKPVAGMNLISAKEHIPGQGPLSATLLEMAGIAEDIVRLRFECSRKLDFKPGQFINLKNKLGVTRPYSIASQPKQSELELHIRLLKGGKMSQYLLEQAKTGEVFECSPALGSCVFPSANTPEVLLLIGTGTGLAPLWSITHAALQAGFSGQIHLYHGSRHASGLYYTQELRKLCDQHNNFHYYPCTTGEETQGLHFGRADELALQSHKDLKNTAVYLCGHPDMVRLTKKKAYLAGASLSQIFADPFNISGD